MLNDALARSVQQATKDPTSKCMRHMGVSETTGP